MPRPRREVPIAVHLLTSSLGAAAIAIAAASGARGLSVDGWVLAPLAATLVAAGMIQLDIHYRGEKNSLDLFEAAILPLLAVFAGPGAVAMVAVTKFASQRLLRVPAVKLWFNVAQWSLATSVASVVFLAIRSTAVGMMGALALAMVAAVVINHVAVAAVISIVQGRPYPRVLAEITKAIAPGMALTDAINMSFGLLFATVITSKPEVSVLFLGPLAVLGWAHRSYTEVALDRTRMGALQLATHELAADGNPLATLGEALEAIRSAFSSAAVAVVSNRNDEGGVVHVHAGDDAAAATAAALARMSTDARARRVQIGDGSAEAGALALVGRRCALVAPLITGDRVTGALVSIDRSGVDGFDDGELTIFEALAREITGAIERSDLHTQLVKERSRLFEIVDRSSDGIFAVTESGDVVEWNPAIASITGFTSPEDGGGRAAALLRAHAGGDEVHLHEWREIGIENLPAEIDILTRVGETRTLACSYSETASEPVSLVVIARDVTRQRELDRLKDDFVATVSHELRTPLTSIVGFTTLLVEPPRDLTTQEHDDALLMIRKGARRLERLIFNLLEVSRIEHRTSAAPGPIDIEMACDNALAEVRELYPARQINVRAGSGAVRAIGNQLSVEQILTNLLANALKYSEHGPIELEVTETHDNLTISVTDYGPGIPAAEQERIFDRFHRMDQHHVQAGTGLGLYISRQLATTMGGTLSVRSELDKGSTFSLTLPGELHLTAVS